MATITITRNLLEQGGDEDALLLSAFHRNSMEFNVERGALVGTYATVLIGTFEFRAVRTGTDGTTDSYIMDVTTILPNLLTIPENNYVLSSLINTKLVTIKAYESDGTLLVENASHPFIALSFAYQNTGVGGGLNDIANKGSSRAIYHNGKICFFSNNSPGVKNLTISTIAGNYTLSNGYNDVTLNENQKITGTLTSTDIPLLSIPVFYKAPFGSEEISWLNRDGGWSFWNFRLLTKELRVKKSNDVATYYQTNASTISLSRQISAEKTVEYTFDTLAYDTAHFEQLCEIQESLAVILKDKIYRVKSCNTKSAVCKQNLKFTLILEIDENIAGY